MTEYTYEPSVADLIEAYAMNGDALDVNERREAARGALAAHDAEVEKKAATAVAAIFTEARVVGRAGVVAEEPEATKLIDGRDPECVKQGAPTAVDVTKQDAARSKFRERVRRFREQGDEPRTVQACPVGGDPSFGQRITMGPREQGDKT